MKCLVIDYIDEDIYREFQKYMEVDLMMLPTKQTLVKIIEPYEVLIMRVDPEIDEEVLEAAKNLRFIGVCSTGLNHIDREAAERKGIKGRVAGRADILLVPDLISGNILHKSLHFFGGGVMAGVVCGTESPVILTSRSDTVEVKVNSIALAAVVAEQMKQNA